MAYCLWPKLKKRKLVLQHVRYGVSLVNEFSIRKEGVLILFLIFVCCQSILSTFVNSLSSSNIQQIIVDQENLWEMLHISNNVNGLIEAPPGSQTCLYNKFLFNCFQNMRYVTCETHILCT